LWFDEICPQETNMGARPKAEAPAKIPPEINGKLRVLAHDLSNSIETIMQASYLLAQMKLEDDAKKWSDLVEKAARDCVHSNPEIREILHLSARAVDQPAHPPLLRRGTEATEKKEVGRCAVRVGMTDGLYELVLYE